MISQYELKMSSSVVLSTEFNVSKIGITAPRILSSGAKQAYLNYGSERLLLQSAVNMSVPFGLSVYDSASGNGQEYSVELSFRDMDKRPDVKQFMNVLTEIDNRMIDEGVKNCKTWFKSDLNRDVVKAFYSPCVRYSKDKEGNMLPYPPNIKLKLRKVNGDFETKFYDIKGNPYKGVAVEDLLVKGVQITAIIECAGVWFAGSKYGLTWRAKQIAIHKLPEKLTDFAFKLGANASEADDSDDEDDAPSQIDDDRAFSKPSVVSQVMPSASDVDDEDGDDIDPPPVPKKIVAKKKVITAAKK